MRSDISELLFASRSDFRAWLQENAETGEGVWLVFGKTKTVVTLSPNDALEEALCFGWIDGQIKRIDETKYLKYFARRRAKSIWSDKNKKTIEMLRTQGIITELGEKAVEASKQNGTWDAPKGGPVSDDQKEAFAAILSAYPPAYVNFCKMPPSVQRTYTMRYLSFKSEQARQRDFEKIVDRLNNNLKPM